jgi:hypothetical protein
MWGLMVRMVPPVVQRNTEMSCVIKVIGYLPFLTCSLVYKPLPFSGLVRTSTDEGNPPYSGVGGASTNGGGAPLGLGEDPT